MTLGVAGTGDIVVEDGTGFSNSDSLASVEFADAFLLIVEPSSIWHDVNSPTTLPTTKGTALRKATFDWFEGQYQGKIRGGLKDYTQFLSLPRIGLVDDEGRSFASNEIPTRIMQAICLVAHDIVINSTAVLPTGVIRGAAVTEETRKLGTMVKTTKWDDSSPNGESVLVAYLAADALVYPFVDSTPNTGVSIF